MKKMIHNRQLKKRQKFKGKDNQTQENGVIPQILKGAPVSIIRNNSTQETNRLAKVLELLSRYIEALANGRRHVLIPNNKI